MSWYQSYETLEVYRLAFDASMKVLDVTRDFASNETVLYSNHLRRSARLICYHISEALRQKASQAIYLHNLANAKLEAEDIMKWIKQAVARDYVNIEMGAKLFSAYHYVVERLMGLLTHPAPNVLQKAA